MLTEGHGQPGLLLGVIAWRRVEQVQRSGQEPQEGLVFLVSHVPLPAEPAGRAAAAESWDQGWYAAGVGFVFREELAEMLLLQLDHRQVDEEEDRGEDCGQNPAAGCNHQAGPELSLFIA